MLRSLTPSDAAVVAAYRSDPDVALFQSWSTPYPLERAEASIAEMAADGGPQLDRFFTIGIADPATDELFGDLALKLEWGGRSAEVGYTLRREHQGQGIATAALGTLLAELFAAHGLQRAHATLHPDNHPSARVLERLGFVHEGTDRLAYWDDDGTRSDDVRYGLLHEDWTLWDARPRTSPEEVALVELGPHNIGPVSRLRVHRSQQRLVASVEESLGDALLPEVVDGAPLVPWYRMVTADGVPAGFVMIAEPTEYHPDPYLWRLLIDRWHQRRGIGECAVQLVVERCRDNGWRRLRVSYQPGPGSPEPFYRGLGFVPTGEFDDDEIVASLEL